MVVTFDRVGLKAYNALLTPSTIGIFAGRKTGIEGYYDCSLIMNNCFIHFNATEHSKTVNNGIGYIGIMLKDAEGSTFNGCEFNIDLPVALTPNSKIALATLDNNGYPTGIGNTFTYVPRYQSNYEYLYVESSNTFHTFNSCTLISLLGNPAIYAKNTSCDVINDSYLATIVRGDSKPPHMLELDSCSMLKVNVEEDNFASGALIINVLSFSNIIFNGSVPVDTNIAGFIFYNPDSQVNANAYNNKLICGFDSLVLTSIGVTASLWNNEILSNSLKNKTDINGNNYKNNISYSYNNVLRFRDGYDSLPLEADISAGPTLPATTDKVNGSIYYNYGVLKPYFFRGVGYNDWRDAEGFRISDFNNNPIKAVMTTAERTSLVLGSGPSGLNFIGLRCYDSDLKKPLWWNGDDWTDATGTPV